MIKDATNRDCCELMNKFGVKCYGGNKQKSCFNCRRHCVDKSYSPRKHLCHLRTEKECKNNSLLKPVCIVVNSKTICKKWKSTKVSR